MSSSAREVVRMTTGMTASSGSCFSSASTSRPLRRGRLTSSRINPGRGACVKGPVWSTNWRACSPLVTTYSGLLGCLDHGRDVLLVGFQDRQRRVLLATERGGEAGFHVGPVHVAGDLLPG